MRKRAIHITDFDMQRLRQLLEGTHIWTQKDRSYLEKLEEELDRAVLVSSREVPPDVVVSAALATGDALESRRGLRVPIRLPASVRHARVPPTLSQPSPVRVQ